MNVNLADILRANQAAAAQSAKHAASKSGASAFSSLLEDASDKTQSEREAKAEKAAGDLVSNALILPMLKQLRRSPWKENSLFSGGIGEKAFGPEFDMQIADRIAHSPRLGIKAALASRLVKKESGPTVNHTNFGKLDTHG